MELMVSTFELEPQTPLPCFDSFCFLHGIPKGAAGGSNAYIAANIRCAREIQSLGTGGLEMSSMTRFNYQRQLIKEARKRIEESAPFSGTLPMYEVCFYSPHQ